MFNDMAEVNQCSPETGLNDLPDELLMYIMTFLQMKELCLVGRVNRRCRRIANSGTLWRHADWLFVSANWQCIQAHITPALVSLRVELHNTGESHTLIPHGVLQDINERCHSFTDLRLGRASLNSPDDSGLPCLPSTLRTLELYRCKWDREWLESNLTAVSVPHLTHVGVSACFDFGDSEMKFVSTSGLIIKVLKLSNCDFSRFTDDGLMSIANHLSDLETLSLMFMPQLTLPVCKAIGSNLTKLTHLHLNGNYNLTGQWLAAITNGTSNLESLIIAGCRNITVDLCSSSLRKQHNMRHLNMSECSNMQDRDLKFILSALGPKLTCLNLEGCCSISEIGLICVANQCKQLETLRLTDIGEALTLESCEAIGRCLTSLRTLSLSRNSSLTDPCLVEITKETHALEVLTVNQCESISLLSHHCLGRLTQLRQLSTCEHVGSEDEIRRTMNLSSVRSNLLKIIVHFCMSAKR